jgi:hypothetical protein
MSPLIILIGTVIGLLCLPVLRSWLWERRLAVSAKRTFKYSMAAGQRKRRERMLAQYASLALVHVAGVGVILGYSPSYSYGRYFDMLWYDQPSFSLEFNILEVYSSYYPGFWKGYAMLVDTNEGGLDVLLSELYRVLGQKFWSTARYYQYLPLRLADPKNFIMWGAMDL